MTETVTMTRPADMPLPHVVDVHPDEVENYKAGGFVVAADPTDGLTKAEIHADLEALGVEFDPRARKADLMALRNEARAKRDATPAEDA